MRRSKVTVRGVVAAGAIGVACSGCAALTSAGARDVAFPPRSLSDVDDAVDGAVDDGDADAPPAGANGATTRAGASPAPAAGGDAPGAPGLPGTTVVVAAGDTLTRIAAAHGVSVGELVEVNGLSGDALAVGQRLFVPASSTLSPASPLAPSSSSSPPTSPPTSPDATLRWPVDGIVLREFAAPQRATGRRPAREGYEGVLIAAPGGTPVQAAASGTVVFAGSQGTTNGIFVVVDHGAGLVTVYAHLARAAVSAGAAVQAGDIVGDIGATGLTGASPRVQLQVRREGVPIDPAPLLPP